MYDSILAVSVDVLSYYNDRNPYYIKNAFQDVECFLYVDTLMVELVEY